VTLVDRAVGRILDAVVQAGLQHNTIIVFTSEHGEQLGEFNIIQKTTFYESSIKVPMIVHVPWINNHKVDNRDKSFSPIQRMSRIEGRYSHIDTVPTLLDLMGVEPPEELQGKSRVPVFRGEETLAESDVFIDWPGDRTHLIKEDMTKVQKLRMQPYRSIISREGWKLTLGPEQNEFYDLNEDRYEQKNLFDEVSEKPRINDLTDRINQWQADTDDTAVLPN
jgi:arylsulfatase A-like enzyme